MRSIVPRTGKVRRSSAVVHRTEVSDPSIYGDGDGVATVFQCAWKVFQLTRAVRVVFRVS